MSKTAVQKSKRATYAEGILRAYSGSVEAIIQTGRLLCQAKEGLKHGEFTSMLQDDMPFTPRTAQRLMAITNDPRLSNPTHVSLLPPSWGTLYDLSQLHDDEFEKGLEAGIIRPDMNRADVKRLHAVPGHLVAPEQPTARQEGNQDGAPDWQPGEVQQPEVVKPEPESSEDPVLDAIRDLRQLASALESPRLVILKALDQMQLRIKTLMAYGLDDAKRRKFLGAIERSREYINTASLGTLQLDTTIFCDETWEQVR